MHPCVLGKDEAIQLLAKVLNHVIPLRLAVHEKVQANFLLETDDQFNLLLDEIFVLGFGDFLLPELEASTSNLLRLLEGSSCQHKFRYISSNT